MTLEAKDISTMSGGTTTSFAFGSPRVSSPGVIATPVENALTGVARLHNAIHGTDPAKRADVTALRAVYRRGARSFDPKRHPSKTRRQWAMARVRNHLSMLATGKRPHSRYTRDDDLLPAGHPLAVATAGERKALLAYEGRHAELGVAAPITTDVLATLLERKAHGDLLDALDVKALWDPDKHPRDSHGRFVHIGAMISAVVDGKQQSGTVVGMGRGQLTVRTDDGTEHKVAAAAATVTDHVGPHMTLAEHAKAHTDADRKAKSMLRSGHPEAAAWTQRRDALGEGLKGRSGALSADEVRRGLGGEHVDGPLKPPPADDLTRELDRIKVEHDAGRMSASDYTTRRQALIAEQGRRADAQATGPTIPRPGLEPTRPDGQEWGTGYSPADPRTDPAYDKYVANLDAKLDTAMKQVGPTDALYDHVDGIDGAYQPARKAMHDEILAELMDRYAKMPREHKAIVLAGPPGAGKSTTIKTHGHLFGVETDDKGNPANYAVVNPDDLKEMLVARGALSPQYADYGIGGGEAACLIHEESSHLSKRLMRQLLAHGTNTILDGTFSGDLGKNMRKVNDLRSEGYDVTGVLIDGDIERSFTNAGKRHRKGATPDPTGAAGPLAGRYVPLGHIEAQRPTGQWSESMQRPHRSQNAENFESARQVFNSGVLIFDNSTGESKLAYRDEVTGADAPVPHEGLGDGHLQKLREGTTGRRVTTGDLPGVIAHGLRQAVDKGRPQYVEGGYQGYGVADAPVGTDYFHITPAGHVTNIKKDVTSGGITRKPIPKPDVERIVDHYVKPRKAGGAAPTTANFDADPANYREVARQMKPGDFVRAADGKVYRHKSTEQTDPNDVRTRVHELEAPDGSTVRANNRQIDATLERIDPEADRAAKIQRNLEHNRRVDAARAARKGGGGGASARG